MSFIIYYFWYFINLKGFLLNNNHFIKIYRMDLLRFFKYIETCKIVFIDSEKHELLLKLLVN